MSLKINFKNMATEIIDKTDRVRRNISESGKRKVDEEMSDKVQEYKNKTSEEITKRIMELEQEWSIERKIETFASTLSLTGILIAWYSKNRNWTIFSGVVVAFLFQHGTQGWCPPIPLFRKFNAKTRKELDWEKYALKYLRGDFDNLSKNNPDEILNAMKKLL